MMMGLAVYWFLILPSLGLLHFVLLDLYKLTAIFGLFITTVFIAVVFGEIKRGDEPGRAFLFLGGVGAVIAVNTVNREYGGKEKVYKYFSVFIWLFAIYPGVNFCILAGLISCTVWA